MTSKEIIKALIRSGIRIDNFAFEDYGAPLSFEGSEAVRKIKKDKNKAWENFKAHPGYRSSEEQDDEYRRLRKEWSDLEDLNSMLKDEWLESLGIGPIEEVEQHGGEGQGDTWYSIKYVPKHNIYLKVEGFYSSYNGTDFNGWRDCTEVCPKEKVITVYESIN